MAQSDHMGGLTLNTSTYIYMYIDYDMYLCRLVSDVPWISAKKLASSHLAEDKVADFTGWRSAVAMKDKAGRPFSERLLAGQVEAICFGEGGWMSSSHSFF